MLTVRKVGPVAVLVHPTRPRRAVFARVGDAVRYTLYGERGRRQRSLPVPEARSRYAWLRKLGYLKWDEAGHG